LYDSDQLKWSKAMPQIACIGEVMIELSPAAEQAAKFKALGFAGDTYNTAITLSRLGVKTAYITRLGQDTYSDEIVSILVDEGISTGGIHRSSTRNPGLYLIENTDDGERSFSYWRDSSAARELFEQDDEAAEIEKYWNHCEWLYFSGISLAVMSEQGRKNFFKLLEQFKSKGGQLAYDSNYRPRLWGSQEIAQSVNSQALALCDIALLTLEDESELWPGIVEDLESAKNRLADFNIKEIVFKRGAEDVVIYTNDETLRYEVKPIKNVVDTTAAGDTFNAGYLAARVKGLHPLIAAERAAKCAGIIIQYPGGVLERSVFLKDYREVVHS
jgi:2-dehydro-3-deoxygluconokinase